MERIAKFERVSADRFYEDIKASVEQIETYEGIKLPRRATVHSAGYDFFAPYDVFLPAGGSVIVPTGVRVRIDGGWVLKIYPRSGLGFKLGLRLMNTVGIIDGDYYYSSNEGHIMIKLFNPSQSSVTLSAGSAFAQGVFVPYGITEDDEVMAVRDGGFGSTDKK